MGIPEALQKRIEDWDRLSRWERSQIGRDLRRLGLSYGEIRQLIEVKKSTLATWCRDVELTPEQIAAVRERTGSRAHSRAGIPVDTQWRRRQEIKQIEDEAREMANRYMKDPFWVAGVVLYWAEGGKAERRLRMSHSEPEALTLLRAWVETYLDPMAEFRAAIKLHANNNEPAARDFWAEKLGLHPSADFTRTFIKPDGTGHRKNHLPFGVCELRMRRGTDAWIRTMTWVSFLRTHWCEYSS